MKVKAFCIIFAIIMILSSLPTNEVLASEISDNATGGGKSSSLTTGSGSLHWSKTHSGYRFTIIDNEGNVMSLGENGKAGAGSVDVFFFDYNSIDTPYYFTNSKTQSLSAVKGQNKKISVEKLKSIAKLDSLPPYPISTNGSGTAIGNGDELREWLMGGGDYISFNDYISQLLNDLTNVSLRNGRIKNILRAEYDGKRLFELPEQKTEKYKNIDTIEIMVEKGYSLMVENLTYIQPATWSSSTQGAGVYFKYHVFGTITNYAECLNLLKTKSIWGDMSGGAYSTPTTKLGWSCLMVESYWRGNGIRFKAPTAKEGTRRQLDELAKASDLSKGTIEGYGMQLYTTSPSDIPPTPTPPNTIITFGNKGVILHENEITRASSLLEAYGDKSSLEILSSITEVMDKNHTVYCGNSHGEDEEGNPISCSGHTCYVKMADNQFNHIYSVNKLLDDDNVVAKTKSFAPKLINNKTGKSKVGLSGKSNIAVYPDYTFNLFRSTDVPTVASYKNSSTVLKDLNELGLQGSNGGIDYKSSREKSGSKEYFFNLKIEQDTSSDISTTYTHSRDNNGGSQTHTLGEIKHNILATVKTYTGNTNTGKEVSTALAKQFKIGNISFTNVARYIIEPDEGIGFYPYIQMEYTKNNSLKTANVLSKDMSLINNSDFIELGYAKTGKSSFNLLMESKQWNSHMRTRKFINDNDIKDRNSVLPGGAVYTLQEQPKNTTYVGVRTWQTVIPDSELSHVAKGADYYSSEMAKERRNNLLNDINKNIEKYKITQFIQEGIEKEQKHIIKDGEALNKITAGQSQTVFGNQLSKADKYYLKSNVPTNEPNSNAIFTMDGVENQLMRTVEYRIQSGKDGTVYLYKKIDGNSKELIGQIDKTDTAEQLINQSNEIQELEDKTRLISNYISAIDRNQGKDEDGETWYNEAFDGISVVLSEYQIEVGFTDEEGHSTSSRSSVLDPKLVGMINSKSDIYNYDLETAKDKVRSSCFAIYPTLPSKPKGYVAEVNWGDTVVPIQIRNIEYLFLSKTFYLPNSTVMDLN